MADAGVEDVLGRYLRDYQARIIADTARRIFVLKSRRIGISQTAIIKAVLIAAGRGTDVYYCSTSMDNSKELVRRTTEFLEALERDAGIAFPAEHKVKSIDFDKGGRIIALPPEKARSREGTIILDEFSYYQRDRAVWAAIAPVADTDSSLQIIVIGTPFGASGMFHEIYEDQKEGIHEHGEWSVYEIDVFDAAAQGFPVDPQELRDKYPSDVFRQEFCCEFLDDIDQYFEYDLLRGSQRRDDQALPTDARRYAGIDLASKKHASAMADLLDDEDEAAWVERVRILKEAGETRDYTPQFDDVEQWLTADAYDGVAVDATGEGSSFGQDLRREFGRKVVDEVGSGDWDDVNDCIPLIRLAMEEDDFWLPDDPRVLNAFTKVQRKETTKGPKFKIKEDADGHGDEFSAVLLAYYRALQDRDGETGTPKVASAGGGPRTRNMSKDW